MGQAPLDYFDVKSSGRKSDTQLNERLTARGLRPTSQREHVYSVLLEERDHPTAEQIFLRAKKSMPEISMATVYNCLDALLKCRLVKLVNLERSAMRYCPNMQEHCHFYCDDCGDVFDIAFSADDCRDDISIPKGFKLTGIDISIRGACPKCAGSKKLN